MTSTVSTPASLAGAQRSDRRLTAIADLAARANRGATYDAVTADAVELLHAELGSDVVMLCLLADQDLQVTHGRGVGIGKRLRPPRDLNLWASLPGHAQTVAEDFAADSWVDLEEQTGSGLSSGMSMLLAADGAPIGMLCAYSAADAPTAGDLGFGALVARVVENAYWRHLHRQRHAQAQRLESVSRMAAGISHDFAGLLTVASLQVGMLLDAMPAEPPQLRHGAHDLEETVKKASSLIEQLQAFIGFREHQPFAVDPAAAIEAMRPRLCAILGEHIALEIETDPNRSTLHMDVASLERIVVNLTRNAAESISQVGRVHISVASVLLARRTTDHLSLDPGRYVRIVVTDDGDGMDEQTLAAAIEPYFTTRDVTAGIGRGLGLSVVHGIAVDEGGALHLDSAPGQGTTATVYLPTADPTTAA